MNTIDQRAMKKRTEVTGTHNYRQEMHKHPMIALRFSSHSSTSTTGEVFKVASLMATRTSADNLVSSVSFPSGM